MAFRITPAPYAVAAPFGGGLGGGYVGSLPGPAYGAPYGAPYGAAPPCVAVTPCVAGPAGMYPTSSVDMHATSSAGMYQTRSLGMAHMPSNGSMCPTSSGGLCQVRSTPVHVIGGYQAAPAPCHVTVSAFPGVNLNITVSQGATMGPVLAPAPVRAVPVASWSAPVASRPQASAAPFKAASNARTSVFQVQERGRWYDLSEEPDLQLKRAFLAGFPSLTYSDAGRVYQASFKTMTRMDVSTGEESQLKVPFGWTAPVAPKHGSSKAFGRNSPRFEEKPSLLTLAEALKQMSPEPSETSTCGSRRSSSSQRETSREAAKPRRPTNQYSTGAVVAAALGVGALAGAAGAVAGVALDGELRGDGWEEALEDLGRETETIALDAADVAEEVGDDIADGAGDVVHAVSTFVEDLF